MTFTPVVRFGGGHALRFIDRAFDAPFESIAKSPDLQREIG